MSAFTELFDFEGGSNPIYEGHAVPGTLTSVAGWRIRKYTWSGTNLSSAQWAGGIANFDKVWDSRATYSYS